MKHYLFLQFFSSSLLLFPFVTCFFLAISLLFPLLLFLVFYFPIYHDSSFLFLFLTVTSPPSPPPPSLHPFSCGHSFPLFSHTNFLLVYIFPPPPLLPFFSLTVKKPIMSLLLNTHTHTHTHTNS